MTVFFFLITANGSLFFLRFSDEIFMTSFSNLPDKGVMEREGEGEMVRKRRRKRRGPRQALQTCFVEDDCLKRLNAFPYKDGEALI